MYNNIVLGLFIVGGAIAIAIAAFSVLSSRKSAELMNAKERQLSLALQDRDIQIERIKQEKDEQIEQLRRNALADKSEFDNRIVVAEKSAAWASQRVAALEKENLELKQQFANRRITEIQHKILVDVLSKKKKKTGRIIIETMGDPESGIFAEDFVKTFTDSGWEIGGKFLPQGVVWTGLIVCTSPDPDAAVVTQALKAAGIPFSVVSETRANATIIVGVKPPLF